MASPEQYEIPFEDIPKGIDLSLKNSDRLRTDAEILAEKKRYNSAIPLITLSVEEFGKALWLFEYFEKNSPIPYKEAELIFNRHKPKIKKVLDYVENVVKSRTLSTRKQYSNENIFNIPEEFDEQKFKNRMWYVNYQKIKNTENQLETRSWKKQPWKDPLYVEELAFGEGYNAEFGQLYYKYFELWRCAYHGIRKFRYSPSYEKILKNIQLEEFSAKKIESLVEKHFFLDESVGTIIYSGSEIELHITPNHIWITPTLVDIIKQHLLKKYQIKNVKVELDENTGF